MVHLPRISQPWMPLYAGRALTGSRPACNVLETPRPIVRVLSDWSRKNGKRETTWTSVGDKEKEVVSSLPARCHNVAMRSVRIGPYLLHGPTTPMGHPLAPRPATILTPAKQVMVNSARFYSRVSQVSKAIVILVFENSFQHNREHVNFVSDCIFQVSCPHKYSNILYVWQGHFWMTEGDSHSITYLFSIIISEIWIQR